METKANYVLIGAFTLAVIAGAFLFVLWFSGASKTTDEKAYRVVFTGSVSGLSRGSSVLFNGVSVGSVKSIDFLADDPSKVAAVVEIAGRTPIKTDTKARLESQGLTGVAAIALTGGAETAPTLQPGADGGLPTLMAERSDFQNLLENVQRLSGKADDVLEKADKLLAANGPAITETLKNVDTFSKALADNSSGVNAALSGVADLGTKIGPLADRLEGLSDDVDKLVKAVDAGKVRSFVDNVESFSGALAGNKDHLDSLLSDSAALARKLNDTAGQLDGAIGDIRGLAKAIDANKIAGVVDHVASLVASVEPEKIHDIVANADTFVADAGVVAETLAHNQANIDAVLANTATVAKNLAGTSQKLDATLSDVGNLVRAVDAKKIASVVDHMETLVASVEPDKIHEIVGGVDSLAQTLARNQAHIDGLLANAAVVAKNLTGTPEKLDAALGDVSNLAKAVDAKKIASVVDNLQGFAQTLGDNRGNVDRTLKDVSELAAKLDNSADRLDALMASVQNFLGSPDTKGALSDVGDAARSVRKFADDLNQRTKEISVGLTRFSGSGLREYESLAVDARRTLGDLDQAIRSFERNPSQVILGAKPALPEYHSGQ